jgi:hypothetical protein
MLDLYFLALKYNNMVDRNIPIRDKNRSIVNVLAYKSTKIG